MNWTEFQDELAKRTAELRQKEKDATDCRESVRLFLRDTLGVEEQITLSGTIEMISRIVEMKK